MRQLIKPDFQENILNISATLAEFLGCPNGKPTLPALTAALKQDYKNVALVVLDGLGMHPLLKNVPSDGFLRRHVGRVLTSVFPSTTTNATTTLQTAAYPMEHGWFGWSLYFGELHRAVDIFHDVDSITGERVGEGYVRSVLPATPFYRRCCSAYASNVVVPPFWAEEPNRYVWDTLGAFFAQISRVCAKPGRQFVYAYCTEPDTTMHRYGVTSAEARATIGCLSDGLETLSRELRDTLLIVTADHGQVDIGACIELYRDGALCSLLACPPYLEARATAFRVKPGRGREFRSLFEEKYGSDFLLTESRQLIAENYFGAQSCNGHEELLGDYIAVGVTDKMMKLSPRGHAFKGHHTSLTEEMTVPLILLG